MRSPLEFYFDFHYTKIIIVYIIDHRYLRDYSIFFAALSE